MTVQNLMDKLELTLLAGPKGLEREVTGCYVGDLLSWVMGRAQEGDAWLTVMGNLNAVAVATLADTACILLTDAAPLDADAREKADAQGVAVLQTNDNSYRTAVKIAELLS